MAVPTANLFGMQIRRIEWSGPENIFRLPKQTGFKTLYGLMNVTSNQKHTVATVKEGKENCLGRNQGEKNGNALQQFMQ